ncbi:hypothetical protein FCV25MIE_18556 [Fagus crenata]
MSTSLSFLNKNSTVTSVKNATAKMERNPGRCVGWNSSLLETSSIENGSKKSINKNTLQHPIGQTHFAVGETQNPKPKPISPSEAEQPKSQISNPKRQCQQGPNPNNDVAAAPNGQIGHPLPPPQHRQPHNPTPPPNRQPKTPTITSRDPHRFVNVDREPRQGSDRSIQDLECTPRDLDRAPPGFDCASPAFDHAPGFERAPPCVAAGSEGVFVVVATGIGARIWRGGNRNSLRVAAVAAVKESSWWWRQE